MAIKNKRGVREMEGERGGRVVERRKERGVRERDGMPA